MLQVRRLWARGDELGHAQRRWKRVERIGARNLTTDKGKVPRVMVKGLATRELGRMADRRAAVVERSVMAPHKCWTKHPAQLP